VCDHSTYCSGLATDDAVLFLARRRRLSTQVFSKQKIATSYHVLSYYQNETNRNFGYDGDDEKEDEEAVASLFKKGKNNRHDVGPSHKSNDAAVVAVSLVICTNTTTAVRRGRFPWQLLGARRCDYY